MIDTSKKIRGGVLWSSASTFFRYVFQFGGLMILARMLSPHDYGLIGLLTVFIATADILVDSGLSGALVKKQNATRVDFSTLTSFSVVMSVFLYALYFFIAPVVARIYDQYDVVFLLRMYSLTIIVFAFSLAPKAYLVKNLEFRTLSIINVISSFIGLVTAVIMAYNKMGALSIVGQYLSNAVVNTGLIIAKSKYRFSLAFSKESFREQFNFGFFTTIANVLKSVSENIYNNVVGKTASMEQTGCYTQSLRLMNVPVGFFFGVIDGTYFPVMSQIHEKGEFERKIAKLNEKTLTVVLLFFSIALSMNREIVYFLFGEKWMGMESSLRMLFIAGLFITWGNLGRNIIKSTAKTILIFKYELLFLLLSLSALFLATLWGYNAILYSFVLVSFFKSVYINILASREIQMKFSSQIFSVLPLIFFCACNVTVSCMFVKINNPFISLVVKAFVSISFLFLYVFFCKRDVLKRMKKKR